MPQPLLQRAARLLKLYPAQFWLMAVGMLISTIGSSMVWPFLMIYVTSKLNLPLATAATLMSVNALVGLCSAFMVGPVVDRFGRKWMLVLSLVGLGAVYVFYTRANSYASVAVLMAMTGLFNPLYRVGGDAMMADLIPPEKRPQAYALLRMSNNLGISIGPLIGGLAAATSYNIAFLGAAAGMSSYALLLAIFARETLPTRVRAAQAGSSDLAVSKKPAVLEEPAALPKESLGGYLKVFADRQFVTFIIAFTLTQFCASLIWILMGAHMKRNYGISESMYSLLPATNAIMVVLLQALVTWQTKKRAPLPVLALGSLFYAAATTGVALSRGFGGFWLSMVVMTTGELMLMPTSTTYTAALAPADMRGRYMSIYSLTWVAAQGIASPLGGLLADRLGPSATWYFGALVGLAAVSAFSVLAGRADSRLRFAHTD